MPTDRTEQGLEPTASSVRACRAPAAGGAEVARRQAAGAASCLAFPHRDQRRISGWVTPRTDHRAVDRPPASRGATGVAGAKAVWPVRYWRDNWDELGFTFMATIPTANGARMLAQRSHSRVRIQGGESATPATPAILPLLSSRSSDSSRTPVAIMQVSPLHSSTTLDPFFRRAGARERRELPATRATLATLFLSSSRSSRSSRAGLLKLGFSIAVEFHVLTHRARPSTRRAGVRHPVPALRQRG